MKLLTLAVILGLCLTLALPGLSKAAPVKAVGVKELNFVFLHGAGGNSGSLQGLSDHIVDELPDYIREYEAANPGIKIHFNTLNRCYPNDVDIDTWAKNIADSINKYFNKDNLMLIGHSMGGKTALYAAANNTGGIGDRVRAVVTINSPVKYFSQYYFIGGADYWRAALMLPQGGGVLSGGVLSSIAYYDSTKDGKWVGTNKHWLALVSGESSPTSVQFDYSGVDPLPRDMDDTIVPISAQYSEGADVVYYGEYAHSDFTDSDELSGKLADQILNYIFGKRIYVSEAARTGTFEYEAGWMPVVERWEEAYGAIEVCKGTIIHKNESYLKAQEWEDVVGEGMGTDSRESYKLRRNSLPVLTKILDSHWETGNTEDCRVYIKTRAAPRSTVQVEWSIFQNPLLPRDFPRDRFEVEITSGTPFTGVDRVYWLKENPLDQMISIVSRAEGPYRWFKAQWRTYVKVPLMRDIASEIR